MNKKIILSVVVAVGVATACSDSALDRKNPNQLTPDSYFKNAEELRAGVNSIYALLQGNSLVGREWFFLNHLRSDDFQSGGGQLEAPRNQILIGAHRPDNFVLNEVWNGLFRSIHRANTVIEKAPQANDASTDLAKRVVAEARFLRAWCYAELLTFWGGVPIYRTTATTPDAILPRNTEAEVITFILEDLNAAEAALPLRYEGAEVGRATRGAVNTLKARILMFRGDFMGARTELQKVISSNVYRLTNAYNDNFQEENEWNTESIFEIGYSTIGDINWAGDGNDPSWGNQERNVRTQEYSPTGWRNLIPSQSLIDEFEHTSKLTPVVRLVS
jgi:starch-binding outer membrane protein, SusD/RagB family